MRAFRTIGYGLATTAIAMIFLIVAAIVSASGAKAVSDGETIPVRIFCRDEMTVAVHGDAILIDPTLTTANALLRVAISEGLCLAAPYPVSARVVGVRHVGNFNDEDGVNKLSLVEVDIGSGSNLWSLHIEIIGKGT